VAPDPRAVAAVRGRWIVLVDDVVTTGSTLAGCATALLDAGAVAVSAVTVARER
jgi:predicted amidophosphoribosyltransferase